MQTYTCMDATLNGKEKLVPGNLLQMVLEIEKKKKKYWKSQANLTIGKSRNHEYYTCTT